MAGSRFSSRRREPVYQIARYHKCHGERPGWTTFESMTFGFHPVGLPIHFCDECEAELALSERPLEEVLLDYLSEPADLAAALSPPRPINPQPGLSPLTHGASPEGSPSHPGP